MGNNLDLLLNVIGSMEKISKQIITIFNNHTGLYNGDPLFETKTSPICSHWVPSDPETHDIFMNWECNHPDADRDFGDTDHCCIMSCADEKHCEEIAGILVNMHTKLQEMCMILVSDVFNETDIRKDCKHYSEIAVYNSILKCVHEDSKHGSCNIGMCPIIKKIEDENKS